jgi:hypothetical protein
MISRSRRVLTIPAVEKLWARMPYQSVVRAITREGRPRPWRRSTRSASIAAAAKVTVAVTATALDTVRAPSAHSVP